MKLVEILARELKEWPTGVVTAVQDADGEVKFDDSYDFPAMADSGKVWIRNGCGDNWRYASSISSDYATAIVTRTQWQEAREALSKAADLPPVGATHRFDDCYMVSWWMREPGNNWYIWSGRNWVASSLSAEVQGMMQTIKTEENKPWSGEGLPPVGMTCERRFTDVAGSSWNGCIILAHGAKKIFIRDNCGDEWAHSIDEVEFRPYRTPEQIAAEEREEFIRELIQVTCIRHGEAGLIYDAGYRKVKDGNQEA